MSGWQTLSMTPANDVSLETLESEIEDWIESSEDIRRGWVRKEHGSVIAKCSSLPRGVEETLPDQVGQCLSLQVNDTTDSGVGWVFERIDDELVLVERIETPTPHRGQDVIEYVAAEYGFEATVR